VDNIILLCNIFTPARRPSAWSTRGSGVGNVAKDPDIPIAFLRQRLVYQPQLGCVVWLKDVSQKEQTP
jgi:hypothetical protein